MVDTLHTLNPDSLNAGGHGRITRRTVSFVVMVVRPSGARRTRCAVTGPATAAAEHNEVFRAGVRLSRAGREVNSPLDERVVKNSRFAPHTVVNPAPEIVVPDRFPD
jgi:hypothetical protein